MDSGIAGFTVAIDFDGTLVDSDMGVLRWRPGALEFLIAAPASGIRLRLHSCRCSAADNLAQSMTAEIDALTFWRTGQPPTQVLVSWMLYEEMRTFLAVAGVLQLLEIWTGPGKPLADIYVDDRAEKPDWLALAQELGVALIHGEQGRNSPVVGIAAAAAGASAPASASTPGAGPIATGAPAGVRV